MPTTPFAPSPRTSAGVTLRKGTALGSLPRGSSGPSTGEGRGLPAPYALSNSLALLSVTPPRWLSLSYLLFSLKRPFFLQVQGSRPLVSCSLSVLRTSGRLCLCIFHVLSRSLSNFCTHLSGSLVVSAFLTPGLSTFSVSLCVCISVTGCLGVSGISRLLSGSLSPVRTLRSHAPDIPWEARSHLRVPATSPPAPSRRL